MDRIIQYLESVLSSLFLVCVTCVTILPPIDNDTALFNLSYFLSTARNNFQVFARLALSGVKAGNLQSNL